MNEKMINFVDYDKISDDLLFLDRYFVLRFNLRLAKKRMESSQRSYFAKEFAYASSYAGVKTAYSIRRNMSFYFSINHIKDFQNSIMLQMNDVVVLKILFDSHIMPWYVGKKRIFAQSPDDQLIIKGKWSEIPVVFNEKNYLSFSPIIIEYEDGRRIEGIRLCINAPDNCIDMDITKFMQFYYIICNTDMVSYASSLANFVPMMNGSTLSSEQNFYNAEDVDWNRNRSDIGAGFFNK